MDEQTLEQQLLAAATEGDLELLENVLQQGASPDTTYAPDGRTALYAAALANRLQVVQHLLKAGADPKACTNNFDTALHVAADRGHVDVAALLLAAGASPNAINNIGATPLLCATWWGHAAMVDVLLWAGADTSARFWAVHIDITGAIRPTQLLPTPAAAGISTCLGGFTPLHVASHKGHLQIVCDLLGAGASIEARTDRGRTPLLVACQARQSEVVHELLRRGAQPDVQDMSYVSVLHAACGGAAQLPMVSALLQVPEVRALVNSSNTLDMTPLHLACLMNDADAAELLLAAGADVGVRAQGMTPLHWALYNPWTAEGTNRCLEVLLAAGADPDAVYGAGAVDSQGFRLDGLHPLQCAWSIGAAWPGIALLATPTNLRRISQRQPLEGRDDDEQHQEQPGCNLLDPAAVLHWLATDVRALLCSPYPGAAGRMELVMSCLAAVMEVYGPDALRDLLQQVLDEHCGDAASRLLQAVHSRWLSGALLVQQDQLQQVCAADAAVSSLLTQTADQQVSGGAEQPSDDELGLWAEAEAAADDRNWRLVVQRLQQLTELQPALATYPLVGFAEGQGRGSDGVAGLCAALLVAWRKLLLKAEQKQQPSV